MYLNEGNKFREGSDKDRPWWHWDIYLFKFRACHSRLIMIYKSISMSVFSKYFSLNVHHLNDSIYRWNCSIILKWKNKHECLGIKIITHTAQKMKISIEDFFSKCDQIRSKLRIWSHLLRKSLMKNFIFCAVSILVVIADF